MRNRPDHADIKGCTDHACVFGHPGGMGTNGGCNCLEPLRPLEHRRRITRNIQILRAEIVQLRAIYPVHPDPTGKTREIPHCPTCDCNAEPQDGNQP